MDGKTLTAFFSILKIDMGLKITINHTKYVSQNVNKKLFQQ